MIRFITGKPGDGKSLFAMHKLLEDLVRGDCFVVSNIPVVYPAMREYVAKRRSGVFDLDSDFRQIEDADVGEFYRFRSGGLVLDHSADFEDGPRLDRDTFNGRMKEQFMRIGEREEWMRPVHYYIDEAHDFFAARDWATNGRGTLYYATKHRHLRDEVYLITQVTENVEKQLRGLVSETYIVRNQLRRHMGPVRMRPVFRVKGYYGVPAGFGAGQQPFEDETFELDASGIAATYRTVGALGVHSTPEKIRNKGWLPWWVVPVGAVGVCLSIGLALFLLPHLSAKYAQKTIMRNVASGKAATAGSPPKVVVVDSRAGKGAEAKEAKQEPDGVGIYRGEMVVDGRRYICTDDGWEEIVGYWGRLAVMPDGRKFRQETKAEAASRKKSQDEPRPLANTIK